MTRKKKGEHFTPRFTITHAITAGLTQIERARGFLEGLTTQMGEVRQRGERAIRRDILAKEYQLNERQGLALEHLMEQGQLAIQEYGKLCPQVNRRTLQRDLQKMIEAGLLTSQGATNQRVYRLRN